MTSFAGKTVVVTGTLSRPRTEIQAMLRAAGARVTNTVSRHTDFVIAGEAAGEKLAVATSLGVTVLDEPALHERLEAGGKPRPGKRRRPATTRASRGALVDAIAANPEDLDAQAIYADQLIDRGGVHAARGELLHLTRAKTRRGVAALRATLAKAGLGGLRVDAGLARTWRCRAAELAAHAALAFDLEPLLHELELELAPKDLAGQLRAIAATPELRHVRRLTLLGHQTRTGRPGAKGLAVLMRSPHWPALEALQLPSCALGEAGVEWIARQPQLTELRELALPNNEVTAKAVMTLAKSPHLGELRRLDLANNKIGASGARAIAMTRHLTQLTWVCTYCTWLNDREVAGIEERFPGALQHRKPGPAYR